MVRIMSKNIIIYKDSSDEAELANLLRYIAGKLDDGYTSGHYPGWELIDGDE